MSCNIHLKFEFEIQTSKMTSNHVFYRLRSEVERLEVSSQETLLTQQAKHNLEISGLKEQLDESERRLRASDMDMASLREKLDQARLDSLQVRILIFFFKKKKLEKKLEEKDKKSTQIYRMGLVAL